MALRSIKNKIHAEMQLFESMFKQLLESRVFLLDKISLFVLKQKGKRVRPILMLIVSKMLGEPNERTYRAAVLIELLHATTLVHDDVVDDSLERRGFFSIQALWKKKIAVLIGDYFLSKILLLCTRHKDYDFLEELASIVESMSEGELIQLQKARRMNFDEEVYYDIIEKKTAFLMSGALGCTCMSMDQPKAVVQTYRQIGMKVGIIFQLKDDLFDYEPRKIRLGKPIGNDIIERKTSLPIIFAAKNCTASERRKLMSLIKKSKYDRSYIKKVIEIVRNKKGVELTHLKIKSIFQEIQTDLATTPDSEYKTLLIELIDYIIHRNK